MSQTYPPASPAGPAPTVQQLEAQFPILRTYADAQRLLADARSVRCLAIMVSIPFEMIRPHTQQAMVNHQQSLTRLAERGGLSAEEAVAVLEDRKWTAMDHGAALQRLFDLYLAWEIERRGGSIYSVYAEGVAARRAGGPTVGNPYTAHSAKGAEWLRGWSTADRELRK